MADSCRNRVAIGWAAMLGIATAMAQDAEPVIACAPERPVAAPGQTVDLRAWVNFADGTPTTIPLHFDWHTEDGDISGGQRALWHLQVGNATATIRQIKARVEVTMPGHAPVDCEVEITLEPNAGPPPPSQAQRRAERMTARAILLRGQAEPLPYGLIGYLLLPAPPRDDLERERYLQALSAWLTVLVPQEDLLGQYVGASRVNVTLLPLIAQVPLPERIGDRDVVRDVAAALLSNYDYTRAQALLAGFDMTGKGRGPHLVAYETRSKAVDPGRLVLDMSGVTDQLMWDWMRYFCWLAGQQRSWSEQAVRKLGLNVRNAVSASAVATPAVLTAMRRWTFVVAAR